MTYLFSRIYQKSLFCTSFLLNWKEPELLSGTGSILELPQILQAHNYHRVLIVTDNGIIKAGLLDQLQSRLDDDSIPYTLFQSVEANPTINTIEQLAIKFKSFNADVLLAVGGGSVMDAAKSAAIIIGKPEKSLRDFKGLLKVRHTLPPLIAVPTTAGTGSEATVAAVVSDPDNKEKFTIMDPSLIPDLAVLDPKLLTSLPPQLTAETGMDALTHAVEAYIGKSNTPETRKLSREAIQLIYSTIEQSYRNGDDLIARENMLLASYKAGRAFTRAYVGNIHALSHALTAFYGAPHGRTNALLLPIVLRYYGSSVHRELADLSDLIELTDNSEDNTQKAEAFIRWVEALNRSLGIPEQIKDIRSSDFDELAHHADKEANPLYPVPTIFSKTDFKELLYKISG